MKRTYRRRGPKLVRVTACLRGSTVREIDKMIPEQYPNRSAAIEAGCEKLLRGSK